MRCVDSASYTVLAPTKQASYIGMFSLATNQHLKERTPTLSSAALSKQRTSNRPPKDHILGRIPPRESLSKSESARVDKDLSLAFQAILFLLFVFFASKHLWNHGRLLFTSLSLATAAPAAAGDDDNVPGTPREAGAARGARAARRRRLRGGLAHRGHLGARRERQLAVAAVPVCASRRRRRRRAWQQQ